MVAQNALHALGGERKGTHRRASVGRAEVGPKQSSEGTKDSGEGGIQEVGKE